MVIGNAAGGKSTLSRALATKLDLPRHSLDQIMWRPGWVRVADDIFDAAHTKLITGDRWLIDGYGPWEAVVARMGRADTIIFVDLPLPRHLWWATKRQVKSLFKHPADAPEGCAMFPVTLRIFKLIWWLHFAMRPKLLAEFEARRGQVRLVHLTTPHALADFIRTPA